MDTQNDAQGSVRSQDRGRHSPPESRPQDQQAPSANHFIKVHESHIPWEGDGIVLHEDERYEKLAGAEEEVVPNIHEHFRILHGAEDRDGDWPD